MLSPGPSCAGKGTKGRLVDSSQSRGGSEFPGEYQDTGASSFLGKRRQTSNTTHGNCLPGRKSCWLWAAFFSGLQEDPSVPTTAETGMRIRLWANVSRASPASSLSSTAHNQT